MTDPVEPRSAIDELLSADIDGASSHDEHARIEADPALRARREELRAVASLVERRPPVLPPAQVDALISRVFDEVDIPEASQQTAQEVPPSAPLISLAGRHRRMPPLVAAAVILLAGLGVILVVTDRSPRSGTTASKQLDKSKAGDKSVPSHGGRSGADTTESKSFSPSLKSSAVLSFIGDYSSTTALRSALRTRSVPQSATSDSGGRSQVSAGQADRCATVVEARDPRLTRSNRRSIVTASVAGQRVLVLEYRARAVQGSRITTRVLALGVAACDEQLNFQR